MSTCLIITGGDYNDLPKDISYDRVIACDLGFEYAKKMNITPDVVLGDFDSYDIEKVKAEGFLPIVYPSKKDDSDTVLAIKHAISKGFDNIVITCALGGRTDHLLANIQALVYAKEQGANATIVSDKETITIISNEEKILNGKPGDTFSLFALTDECKNVSIKGSEYDADDITLNSSFPLGLSNKLQKEKAAISLSEGMLLVIVNKSSLS